jgi:hypothetical protein
MTEKTVEEIKSRRIAITKHQRDIAASVEVLRSLTQEERYSNLIHMHDIDDQTNPKTHMDTLTLALMETNAEWNRGRSNGLVAEEAEDNSWERVFYDFFELQASMDALEQRADKIQDGIFGLLSVKLLNHQIESQEKSDFLNAIFSFASVAVVPFTIVGGIFSVEFTSGGPRKNPVHFAIAMVVTFFVLVAGYFFLYYASKKANKEIFLKFLSELRDRFVRKKRKDVKDEFERGNRAEKVSGVENA